LNIGVNENHADPSTYNQGLLTGTGRKWARLRVSMGCREGVKKSYVLKARVGEKKKRDFGIRLKKKDEQKKTKNEKQGLGRQPHRDNERKGESKKPV